MRRVVGLDRGHERVPDETTILNFRRLLERHDLTQGLFDQMNAYLASRGLQVRGGTIVDATLIAAPSSTKNQAAARDPEMRQTRTVMRRGSMGIRRIEVGRRQSASMHPAPGTSPTDAIAIAVSSTRSSAARTARSPGSAPKSSTALG